jgi:hypothetical protein
MAAAMNAAMEEDEERTAAVAPMSVTERPPYDVDAT